MPNAKRKIAKNIRKKPTQARARETYEAILDGTAQVLVEEGFDRASTNRVAERAGVSIGSLYQYFPNKESLVDALMRRELERKLAFLAIDPVEASRDVRGLIRQVVGAFVEAAFDEPEIHQVFFEQVPRGTGSPLREFEEASLGLLITLMKFHQKAIRSIPIERMAYFVYHAVQGVIHAHMADKKGISTSTLIAETCLLVEGYMLPGASAD